MRSQPFSLLLPTSQPSSSPGSDASSAAQAPADAGSQEESPTGSRLQHDRAAKSAAKPAAKGKGKKGGKGKVPAPVGNDDNSGWESEQPYALLSSGDDEPEIVAPVKRMRKPTKLTTKKKARREPDDPTTRPIDPQAGRPKTEFAQFQNIFHKKVKGSLPPGASIGEVAALVGAWWRFVNEKVGDGIDPANLLVSVPEPLGQRRQQPQQQLQHHQQPPQPQPQQPQPQPSTQPEPQPPTLPLTRRCSRRASTSSPTPRHSSSSSSSSPKGIPKYTQEGGVGDL